MTTPARAWTDLTTHLRETAVLKSVQALLGWDEMTGLPNKAAAYRGEQSAMLAGLIHARETDPRIGDCLETLESSPLAREPHSDEGATIRETRRRFTRATKLDAAFVKELSRLTVEAQHTWVAARKDNDFARFAPCLDRMFELKRQQADAFGHTGERYDALVEDYEVGTTAAELDRVLAALRTDLLKLLERINASSTRPDESLLARPFPRAQQEQIGRLAATRIGFDFDAGRLDVSPHPFCTTLGPSDVRLTTRYHERQFASALFGTIHESGHGLYEQGLRSEWYGLPPGEAVSLGIHESQSLFWENLVGRSHGFWEHFWHEMTAAFPDTLTDVSREAFYAAICRVRPSLIRVEADAVTYSMHIVARFELERDLLNQTLRVQDLPEAWNDKYQTYLGITPDTDADGCLQDIHWSAGLIGYFPTYSLGHLYSAMFYQACENDLGNLDTLFSQGEFEPVLMWLREHVHQAGSCYRPSELCERITGQPLTHEPLIAHLERRLTPIYDL